MLNYRVNVSVGPQEDRMMTTGKHTVADIYCNCCQQIVGWKYVSLLSKSQNIVLQTLEGPKASICSKPTGHISGNKNWGSRGEGRQYKYLDGLFVVLFI